MEQLERRDKVNYYLDLAEIVSQRCTCLRRHYGAVIVKNDEVISTGYVGAPRGRDNCSDLGYCLCRSVHAEANAIICASRRDMIGATLYLVGRTVERDEATGALRQGAYIENAVCCSMCKRLVINAGIAQVVCRDDKEHYRVIDVSQWIVDDESLRGVLGY